MELRNLKTFQLAAKYLNFTKAAQELNFTQPTVTAQIQALEQELKQELFMRVGKKTFLTPAGEILKHYTDQIFQLIEETEAALAELSHPQGKITIAASETYCTHYFPPILSQYMKMNPNVQLKLISCHSPQVIEGINDNRFDIGIITGTLHKKGVTNLIIEEEDMVLIVAKQLYEKYSIEQILHTFPFIKYRIDGVYAERMREYMSEANLAPQKVLEFGSLEAVKRAVLNQVGYGLTSNNLVKKEILDGELVALPLSKKPIRLETSLLTLEEKTKLPVIKSFMELVQMMWKKIHDFA
ncbi:LysR family transcriptional regulator [Brevibacillus marinus]|uniref:LysR family transcriptional regulator n=1 Tax=Brevibacillus marinus TaxID=2496837 RepID=UPI000F829C9C|nr:LysR family transcriptional regulator [Brevibacillus marinus]